MCIGELTVAFSSPMTDQSRRLIWPSVLLRNHVCHTVTGDAGVDYFTGGGHSGGRIRGVFFQQTSRPGAWEGNGSSN